MYSALNFWLGPLWGSSVHRRYGSNYSLWPEQAGPRRAIPLKLAALLLGSFSALAIYNVVTYFLRPVSIQEVAQENAVARVPINTTATTPVTAADPVEPGSRIRSRRSVAKSTLPTIGTRAITPSPETDGLGDTDSRGGDVLEGDTPVAALTAPPTTQPITSIEDSKPADKPSRAVSEPRTKHAARERRFRVHKHRTVRIKRPSLYASGHRNGLYFGYGGYVTYGYGGYGRVYAWPQW